MIDKHFSRPSVHEERPSNLKEKHYKNSTMKLLVLFNGLIKKFELQLLFLYYSPYNI